MAPTMGYPDQRPFMATCRDIALGDMLAWAAPRVPAATVMRAAGIRSRSNTIGNLGPNAVMRRNTARAAQVYRDHPDEAAVFDEIAERLWAQLQEVRPDAAAANLAAAEQIHPGWRIGSTPWTSGILNHGVPLAYHNDDNNIPHTWSGLLWAKHPVVTGGHLHLPDPEEVVRCEHGVSLFFCGWSTLHGVTPIHDPGARLKQRRWSIVFYMVNKFVGIPGPEEAVAESQLRRTQIEDTLIADQRAKGLLKPAAREYP